jgi:hypothetical protein
MGPERAAYYRVVPGGGVEYLGICRGYQWTAPALFDIYGDAGRRAGISATKRVLPIAARPK